MPELLYYKPEVQDELVQSRFNHDEMKRIWLGTTRALSKADDRTDTPFTQKSWYVMPISPYFACYNFGIGCDKDFHKYFDNALIDVFPFTTVIAFHVYGFSLNMIDCLKNVPLFPAISAGSFSVSLRVNISQKK